MGNLTTSSESSYEPDKGKLYTATLKVFMHAPTRMLVHEHIRLAFITSMQHIDFEIVECVEAHVFEYTGGNRWTRTLLIEARAHFARCAALETHVECIDDSPHEYLGCHHRIIAAARVAMEKA